MDNKKTPPCEDSHSGAFVAGSICPSRANVHGAETINIPSVLSTSAAEEEFDPDAAARLSRFSWFLAAEAKELTIDVDLVTCGVGNSVGGYRDPIVFGNP
jgi:hypothetical protein